MDTLVVALQGILVVACGELWRRLVKLQELERFCQIQLAALRVELAVLNRDLAEHHREIVDRLVKTRGEEPPT